MKPQYTHTPWYPADVPPSVPGMYEVKSEYGYYYSYWNGKKFGYRAMDISRAFEYRDKLTHAGDTAIWRGLTRQSAMEIRNEI
jgi:hypothetical protein